MRSRQLGGILFVCVSAQLFATVRWHRNILLEASQLNTSQESVLYDAPPEFLQLNSPPLRRYGDPLLKKPRAFHPHSGAVDEFGQYGYVHDPTVLRQRKMILNETITLEERRLLCAPLGKGPEGGNDTGKRVFEKIRVSSNKETTRSPVPVKVFCGIYTYPGNNNQTKSIRETWGRRCDGFLAASTETVHGDATVRLLHHGGHQGMYKGIWQKVRSMLGYIYDNFLDDFDFYFLSGDDTYVIVENLKAFLGSSAFVEHAGGEHYPKPVYTGAWIHPFWLLTEGYSTNFYYMGGGAGYILNRAAVKGLVELALPTCRNTTNSAAEDVFVAECLERHLNVTGYDARDEQEGERFIPYDPVQRALLQELSSSEVVVEEKKHSGPRVRKLNQTQSAQLQLRQQLAWLQIKHGWTPKYGADFLSPTAISFHMVQPAVKMRRYEQLIYHNNHGSMEGCGETNIEQE
jgi:hypothetical protein